jgi:hypothetical protein
LFDFRHCSKEACWTECFGTCEQCTQLHMLVCTSGTCCGLWLPPSLCLCMIDVVGPNHPPPLPPWFTTVPRASLSPPTSICMQNLQTPPPGVPPQGTTIRDGKPVKKMVKCR